ncbi:hypothetical protein, partial [Brevibacillus parabrevis]|uniref:hypothetical protein n=1 Tax=Brevibacillus parabrevis TaxID=54914 RepID=UPI0028D20E27
MQATDGVMTYHDLQVVWPYGPIRLDSLTFLHQTGTHATLRLTGRQRRGNHPSGQQPRRHRTVRETGRGEKA